MSATGSDHLLLRTIRGEETPRPPVWALGQAGQWDPEFRKLCTGRSPQELARDAGAAAAAALLPRRFGVDAITLFSDIAVLPTAWRLQPARTVRTTGDVNALGSAINSERYSSASEILCLVRQALLDSLPVIVLADAPFAVASGCVGTGRDVEATLRFAREEAAVWHALLTKLEAMTIEFLNTLVAAGAAAYQLCDPWAGELARHEYLRWAQPFHRAIFQNVPGAPSILFVKENPHLDLMAVSGAKVVCLGTRHDLAATRREYPHLVFQGNVDRALLRSGSAEQVAEATRQCVAAGQGSRHVVNLNDAVEEESPAENFAAFVSAVVGP